MEPLTPEFLAAIIERERPDAILPTVGGQTALNLAVDLADAGTLAKYDVKLIGASIEAIKVAEDRQLFKDAMRSIGLDLPQSGLARNQAEAMDLARALGLPAPASLAPAVAASLELAGAIGSRLPSAGELLLLLTGRTGLPGNLSVL